MAGSLPELPDLDPAITALREEVREYPFAPEHYIADLALYGLAIDILEHSLAVQLLRNSEVPRAAFANARAAFEAGMDILLLTSERTEYDVRGCLARAHELNEDKRLQARYNRASSESGLSPQSEQDFATLVEEDAVAWDKLVPGRGDFLRSVVAEFSERPSGKRKHWSGMSREEIGLAVAQSLGAEPGVGQIFDAMYGGLSSHSHPRMRVGQRETTEGDTGGFVFSAKPSDKTAPAGAASYACSAAVASLKRRRTMFPPAA